jgi:hypothetical protein
MMARNVTSGATLLVQFDVVLVTVDVAAER